jgi:hypothetical protein
MTKNAFGHLEYLGARTGTVLSGTPLVQDRDPPLRVSNLELAVLGEASCPNRLQAPPGPLICYWSDNPSERSLIDVTDLILLKDERGRVAALEYVQRLAERTPPVIAPAAKALLARTCELVRSDDAAIWRPAAVKLHDALADDFFLTLAGFVQSKTIGYQDGANTFVTTLLRPSLRMIDSLPLEVLVPGMERDKVLRLVEQCRDVSGDIDEACGEYFARLGHLPLEHELGMGRVVERWADSLTGGQVWDRIWGWADRTGSPLARYHACLFFVEHPELVCGDRRESLRHEVLAVIRGAHGGREDSAWWTGWRVRCDLARHYAQYLECQTPGLESERVANLAWWLAERVGSKFGRVPEHLSRVHTHVILPTQSLSNQAWELLRPALQPSGLRFATIHIPSCWSLSLLCEIGQFPGGIVPRELLRDYEAEIRRTLLTGMLGFFPPPREAEEPVTYAFDRGFGRTAEAWAQDQSEDEEEILRTVLAMYCASTAPERIRRCLDTISNASPQEQFLTCQFLRVLAYIGKLPDDLLWELVTREDGLLKVLESIDSVALDVLFDALVEHQQQHGGRWAQLLPNLFASAVLRPTGDLERRRLLLAYCLISSLAGGTVEAVARVLHAEDRMAFERDISYWRARCNGMFAILPAWGQARLRPVLALLSRMQGTLEKEEPRMGMRTIL